MTSYVLWIITNIEQILTLLSNAPPRIAELTAGLPPGQLQTSPGHDEWSLNDMLAHLRSCAYVWGNCMKAIVDHDRPNIRVVNPRSWIDKTDSLEQKFGSALHAFTEQRTDEMAFLGKLTLKDWSRTATVTGAGAPLVRTLHSYAHRLARHERMHIKQIQRIGDTMRRVQCPLHEHAEGIGKFWLIKAESACNARPR